MWLPQLIDLKLRLALRVVALAAFCLLAAWGYMLVDSDRSAKARTERIAGIVAKDMALQQGWAHWLKDSPDWFPDLDKIATPLMAPGLCIAYRAGDGEILQRLCSGAEFGGPPPPLYYAALYRWIFRPGREAASPVLFDGKLHGEAVASIDADSLIEQSWRETGRLLAVMATTLLLLCLLVYAALARALSPTRAIRMGLERLAANDLAARLPPFDLAELSAVGAVFNALAEKLERALAERNELTKKLIAVQDEERRHLARDLHDEFGQCLAAIGVMAASAGQTAERQCPELLPECRNIARIAAQMMETLRGALFRLRPPDVEELGLTTSLESLVAGWNSRCRGRPRFEIAFRGRFDPLPNAFGADLYRIAQEAITNAAKHAEASRITLRLDRREGEIELIVADDGKSNSRDSLRKSGMGLLGMQERITALGGRLRFETGRPSGTVLHAVLPLPAERS